MHVQDRQENCGGRQSGVRRVAEPGEPTGVEGRVTKEGRHLKRATGREIENRHHDGQTADERKRLERTPPETGGDEHHEGDHR